MRKAIAAIALLAAGAPLAVQDRAIGDRVKDLEKRVGKLEQADLEKRVGDIERAAIPAQAGWTQQRADWLFFAAGDLLRTKASPAAMATKSGDLSEQQLDAMRIIQRASEEAFEATREFAAGKAKNASRLCDQALAHYNQVAKFVGADERKVDSAQPDQPPPRGR